MISTRTLSQLNAQLQRAPRDSRTGTGWLTFLVLTALTASTWIALIVSGGVLMFMERKNLPLSQFPPEAQIDDTVLELFVLFAYVACVFVIPPLFSLITQSAALGASVHQYRLATLRLIGLSTGDVVRMILLGTMRQTLLGLILGTVLSIVTAPVWVLFSFQGLRISTWEMLLPWWGYPLVWGIVLMLALLAALLGLRRVLITPLGVARREPPKALQWWRAVVFCVVLAAGFLYLTHTDVSLAITDIPVLVMMSLVLLMVVSSISIIGSWGLQVLGFLSRSLPGSANFIATRRVVTHGKQTWGRVSTMTFLSVLLGYIAFTPPPHSASVPNIIMETDVLHGMLLTVVIGVVITLISAALSQALSVYEEAELTEALDFIGAPLAIHGKVAFRQTFVPMLLTGGCAYLLGMGLSWIMFSPFVESYPLTHVMMPLITFFLSVLVVSSTAFGVEPLRRQVLRQKHRPND